MTSLLFGIFLDFVLHVPVQNVEIFVSYYTIRSLLVEWGGVNELMNSYNLLTKIHGFVFASCGEVR